MYCLLENANANANMILATPPDLQLFCTFLQRVEKGFNFSFTLFPILKLFFWVNLNHRTYQTMTLDT